MLGSSYAGGIAGSGAERRNERGGGRSTSLARHLVVFRVTPDPELNGAIRTLNGKCAMGQANANGVEIPDFLEVQGWMIRIGFQELIILFGQIPGWFGQ